MVMESDMGVFHPYGIQFTGNADATAILQAIVNMTASINTSTLTGGGDGTDIGPWMSKGVPGASLASENQNYFDFHHSNGDTMTVLNSTDMDLAAAVWAVTAYVVADLDDMLPR
jgi:carboxypeptidase Q